MQGSRDENEYALGVLFGKIEEACKQAGLNLEIVFEDDDPGVWTTAIWIEGSMVVIYGGEVTVTDMNHKGFLTWAQIEGATSIADLPEGLAHADILIREKAERKRRELIEFHVGTHMGGNGRRLEERSL